MANKVKPRICRTNEISIPIDTEECVLWLNPVQSVDDIKNPTRDYAWITPDNTVYVFNGHKIVPIFSTNDSHIKWGHVDGDIKDQKDLYEILLKTVNGVKQNGTELPKDLEQKVNVSVPIMHIKVNNTELEPNNYTVNIDLTSYAKTSDIPTKLSQLSNDTGYVTPETIDVPIQTITVNGNLLTPDEHKNVSINIRTLKSVSTTYQASESDTNIPTGTWLTTIPKLDARYQHLWTKTVYTYSDGSTETSYTVATTHSGIQLGGRNLFYNSSLSENLDRIKVINKDGITTDFTTEDGFKCLHISGRNTNDTCYFITSAQVIPNIDDIYTITADLKFKNIQKGDSTNGFSLYGFSSKGETQDGIWKEASIIKKYNVSNSVAQPIEGGSQDWKRIGATYIYNYEPTQNLSIGIYFRNFTGDVYVKNIKIERGNIPTDWTPAPEDLEAYADSKTVRIFKGTTEDGYKNTDWVDGDLYVQYEE